MVTTASELRDARNADRVESERQALIRDRPRLEREYARQAELESAAAGETEYIETFNVRLPAIEKNKRDILDKVNAIESLILEVVGDIERTNSVQDDLFGVARNIAHMRLTKRYSVADMNQNPGQYNGLAHDNAIELMRNAFLWPIGNIYTNNPSNTLRRLLDLLGRFVKVEY